MTPKQLKRLGDGLPPVAFSSLCRSRAFARTETFRRFVEAYGEGREGCARLQPLPPDLDGAWSTPATRAESVGVSAFIGNVAIAGRPPRSLGRCVPEVRVPARTLEPYA